MGEHIVGAILGPGGKALLEIQHFSGANIQISKKGIYAPGTRNRWVTISGTPNAISTAQYLIEQRISEEEAKRARHHNTAALLSLSPSQQQQQQQQQQQPSQVAHFPEHHQTSKDQDSFHEIVWRYFRLGQVRLGWLG